MGSFTNRTYLTLEETQTLIRWVKAGAPRGDGPDPLTDPLDALPDWAMGEPDAIVKMPEPEQIPAEGVLDYRYVSVENPFEHDVWLSGLDVKPGNRKVVHHIILYAKWPGMENNASGKGVSIVGWAPGASGPKYPDGVAKRLPAEATLTFELHYTTCGSEQEDQSEDRLLSCRG